MHPREMGGDGKNEGDEANEADRASRRERRWGAQGFASSLIRRSDVLAVEIGQERRSIVHGGYRFKGVENP